MNDENTEENENNSSSLDDLSENSGILPLDSLYDIPINVTVVLGKKEISINDLLKLESDSILELDTKVGDPVDVLVNRRLVARGEVVIVDEKVGVTMTEIIKSNIYEMD